MNYINKNSMLNAPAICVVPLTGLLLFIIILYCGELKLESLQETAKAVTILSVVAYSIFLSALFLRNRKIEFIFLFILMSWPFYFGQQFIMTIKYETKRNMINITQLTSQSLMQASLFTLLCLNTLCLIYIIILGNSRTEAPVACIQSLSTEQRRSLRKASLVVAAIVALPTIITLLRNYSLSVSYGYIERINEASLQLSGIDNIAGILAGCMPFSLYGLVISRNKGERWPFVVIALYMIMYSLSGSRINLFVQLMTLALIWSTLISKLQPLRQLLVISGIALLVAAGFSVISFLRSDLSAANARKSIGHVVHDNNLIYDAVYEAGQTIVVLGAAFENMPENVPYAEGETYFSGIVYILPNFLTGDYYDSVKSVDESFAPYLVHYGGVGSSFIAEAYFNYGNCAVLIMILFGMLLGKLQRQFEISVSKMNYFYIFACVACFAICVFYVRSDVRTFLRNFVWMASPILVISWMIFKTARSDKEIASIVDSY